MIFETLQSFGDAFIVGIQGQEQSAPGFADAVVEGCGFALVFLKDIANGEIGFGLPLGYERLGAIGRTVIDDEPFEIATGLSLKALVNARQGAHAVEGGSEYREQVFSNRSEEHTSELQSLRHLV